MMKYRFSSNSVNVWLTACREGYFLTETTVLEEADELPENEKTLFHSFHAQLRNVICGTLTYPYNVANEKEDSERPDHLLEIQLQKYKKYKREEMIYSLALMKAACKVYMRVRQVPVLHHQCINLETFIVSLFEEGKRVFNALCSVEDAAVYVGIGSINQRVTTFAKETIAVFKSRVYKKALGRQLNMENDFMLPFNISTVVKANDSRFLLCGMQTPPETVDLTGEFQTGDESELQANSAAAKIIYKEQTIIEEGACRKGNTLGVGGISGSSVTVLDPENKKGLIQDIYAFYNPVTNGLGHIKIKLKTEPPQIISIYLPTSRALHLANTTKWNFPVSLSKRGVDDTDDYYEQVPIKRIKTYSRPSDASPLIKDTINNPVHHSNNSRAIEDTNKINNVAGGSSSHPEEKSCDTLKNFQGCSLHYNVSRDNTTTYHHPTCPKNKDIVMTSAQVEHICSTNTKNTTTEPCTYDYQTTSGNIGIQMISPALPQASPPSLQQSQTKIATVRPQQHQEVTSEVLRTVRNALNNTETEMNDDNNTPNVNFPTENTDNNVADHETNVTINNESTVNVSSIQQNELLTNYDVSMDCDLSAVIDDDDDLQACLDDLINSTSSAELLQMGNACNFDWLLHELDLELNSDISDSIMLTDECSGADLNFGKSNDYIGLT
ncbi:protein EE10 [Proboscivirus elephantidbeta5]|uniref:Protein EE10 n=1 Tax=Elephant endotheliotropic herpesvirus 5 TaxID=768738 RepID=A0A075CZK9_9BETA|nr:protein EE10 [Elephant endotheliotropic herpesvirus 5]AHC02833.1 protein EE10 [Elephant endotheliotropic herpesvirus 5]